MSNKADYIKSLSLEPHPEGGWFKEIYHSDDNFYDQSSQGNRYYYTSIYFLLDDTSPSHFHQLNHDEMWFYHDGDMITIHCISPEGKYYQVHLGKEVDQGQQLQFKVPRGTVFASEVTAHDQFCLVSCVVSPGFDYHDFKLAKQDDLLHRYPELSEVLQRLTIE